MLKIYFILHTRYFNNNFPNVICKVFCEMQNSWKYIKSINYSSFIYINVFIVVMYVLVWITTIFLHGLNHRPVKPFTAVLAHEKFIDVVRTMWKLIQLIGTIDSTQLNTNFFDKFFLKFLFKNKIKYMHKVLSFTQSSWCENIWTAIEKR